MEKEYIHSFKKEYNIDTLIKIIKIYNKVYPNNSTNYNLKSKLINLCKVTDSNTVFQTILLCEKKDGSYDHYSDIKQLYTQLIKEHYDNNEYIHKVVLLLKEVAFDISNDDLVYLYNVALNNNINIHYIETLKWIIDFKNCSSIYDCEGIKNEKNIIKLIELIEDSCSIDLYTSKYNLNQLQQQKLSYYQKASEENDGEAIYQLLHSKYSYQLEYSPNDWNIEEINHLFNKAMLLNHKQAILDYAKWYLKLDNYIIKKYKLNEYLKPIINSYEKIYNKNNSNDISTLAQLYIKNQQFKEMIDLYENTIYLLESTLQCINIYHKGLYKQKKDIKKLINISK